MVTPFTSLSKKAKAAYTRWANKISDPDFQSAFDDKYGAALYAEIERRESAWEKLRDSYSWELNAVLISWDAKLKFPESAPEDYYALTTAEAQSAWDVHLLSVKDDIEQAKQKIQLEAQKKKSMRQWERICDVVPRAFRKVIDRAQLCSPEAYDAVMAFEPANKNGHGLLCYGPSGRGKTRSVFDCLLCWSMCFEDYVPFEYVEAVDLKAKASQSRGASVIDGILNAQVVFIDDLDKATLTQPYQEQLFKLVNYRTSNLLPLIITCQCGERGRLIEKLTGGNAKFDEAAEAIVRRISEFCARVNFGA